MLLAGMIAVTLGLAALVRRESRRHRTLWWSAELAGLSRAWHRDVARPRHRLFTGPATRSADVSQGGMLPC